MTSRMMSRKSSTAFVFAQKTHPAAKDFVCCGFIARARQNATPGRGLAPSIASAKELADSAESPAVLPNAFSAARQSRSGGEGDSQQQDAARWLHVQIREIEEETFKQSTRGRPGKNTRYIRETATRYRLSWTTNHDANRT